MLKNEDGKRNSSFLPNHESGYRSREIPARKDLDITEVGKYKTANVLDLEGISENIFFFFQETEKG